MAMIWWNTGFNMPGYMPDNEPRLAGDWFEVFAIMRETLERFADDYWEAHCDAISGEFESAIANLAYVTPGTEVTIPAGPYVFWIAPEATA